MKRNTILLLAVMSFSSCFLNDSPQKITINQKYSIDIPSNMSKSADPHPDASLFYENRMNDLYVMVIDESSEEFRRFLLESGLSPYYETSLAGYSTLLLDGYEEKMTILNKSDIIEVSVNKLPARVLTIDGKVDGYDITYSLAYIQGKKDYYQILVWTTLSQGEKYKDQMNKIINSFREL